MPSPPAAAAFCLTVALLGCSILFCLDRAHVLDGAERLVLCLPCGAAALGALLFIFTACGAPFGRPLVISVLSAGALPALAAIGFRFTGMRRGGGVRPPGLESAIIGAMAAILFAGVVAGRFTPPVSNPFDTEMYHFPYAAILYRTHALPAYATLSFGEVFSFPPALFVFYAALWAIEGHIDQLTPNLLPLFLALSWAGLTSLAVRRVLKGSWTAVSFSLLLMIGAYESPALLSGEGTDLLPVLLGAGAVYLLCRDRAEHSTSRMSAAVTLLALGAWTKYHGIPFALTTAAGWAIVSPLRPRRRLQQAGWILVGSLGGFAAFMVRSALVYGNPLYPGECRWLGGYLSTPWAVGVAGWWEPSQLFFTFPAVLVLALREPAVIFGVPAAVLALRRSRGAASLMAWSALLYLLLFFAVLVNRSATPLRFVGVSLGILSWFGGSLADGLRSGDTRSRSVVAVGAVAAASVALLTGIVNSFRGPAPMDFAAAWSSLSSQGDALRLAPYLALIAVGLMVSAFLRGRLTGFFALWLSVGAVGMMTFSARPPLPALRALAGADTGGQWMAAPSHSTLESWMQRNLENRAVVYSYYPRRWSLPGAIAAADDPLAEPSHRPNMSSSMRLEALRRLGVGYVLDWQWSLDLTLYQGYTSDQVLKDLRRDSHYELMAGDSTAALYRVSYSGGAVPIPVPAHPMPWLMDFSANGPGMGARRVTAGQGSSPPQG